MAGRVTSEVRKSLLTNPNYTPEKLLKVVRSYLGVDNDNQLAEKLDISHSLVSLVRSKHIPLSCGAIVAILDAVPELSIAELRRISGFPKDYSEGVL